jgi:hypothetical protein
MKLPKRLLAVAGVATGAAIPLLFAASAANAATPTAVKVVTHLSNREDTCGCTTNVLDPNQGYVWAYDNISRQLTVTQKGAAHYTVTVTDNGSFSAFAQPNNADTSTFFPTSATGSIKGSETWDVTEATQGLDPSALGSQTGNGVSTTQMIDELVPGGNANLTSYAFGYRSDNGSTYTQTQPASGPLVITGNITG